MTTPFDSIEHNTFETIRDVEDKVNSIGGSSNIVLDYISNNLESIHQSHKALKNYLYIFSLKLNTIKELIGKIEDEERKNQIIDNLYNDTLISDILMNVRAANRVSENFTSILESEDSCCNSCLSLV